MIRLLAVGPRAAAVAVEVPGVVVAGRAASWGAGTELAVRLTPDVALVDVESDPETAVQVIRTLARRCRVLALTAPGRPEVIVRAARAGAAGYVLHGSLTAAELSRAVHVVHAGGGYIAPAVAPTLLRLVGQEEVGPATAGTDLTDREVEVMALIARGMSNAAIAAVLHISPKTVKNHINRAYGKLDVGSRDDAIKAWSALPRSA